MAVHKVKDTTTVTGTSSASLSSTETPTLSLNMGRKSVLDCARKTNTVCHTHEHGAHGDTLQHVPPSNWVQASGSKSICEVKKSGLEELPFEDPLDSKVFFLSLQRQLSSDQNSSFSNAASLVPYNEHVQRDAPLLKSLPLKSSSGSSMINRVVADSAQENSQDSSSDGSVVSGRSRRHRSRLSRLHGLLSSSPSLLSSPSVSAADALSSQSAAIHLKGSVASMLRTCTVESRERKELEVPLLTVSSTSQGRVRLTAGGQVVMRRNGFCC